MSSTVWKIAALLMAEKIYVPEPQLVVVGKADNQLRPWEGLHYHGVKSDIDLDKMLMHKGTSALTLKKCRIVQDSSGNDLIPMYQPPYFLKQGLEGNPADREKFDAEWRQKVMEKEPAIREWIGSNTEHSADSIVADNVLKTILGNTLSGPALPHSYWGTGSRLKFYTAFDANHEPQNVKTDHERLVLTIVRYMMEWRVETNPEVLTSVKFERTPAYIHHKYRHTVRNILEAAAATRLSNPLSFVDHTPAGQELNLPSSQVRKNRQTRKVYGVLPGNEFRTFRKNTKSKGEVYVPKGSYRHIISRTLEARPDDIAYRERLWKIFQRMDPLHLGRPFFDLLYTTLRSALIGEYDRRLGNSSYQESWELNGWPEFNPDIILEGRKKRSKAERQEDKEKNWMLDRGPGSSQKMTSRELKELLSHLLVGDKVVQFINNPLYPLGYRLVDDPRSKNFRPVRWADPTQMWPEMRSVDELRKAHLASLQLLTMVDTSKPPRMKLIEDRLLPVNPKSVIEPWEDETDPSQITLTHERIEQAAWSMAKKVHKRQIQRTNYRDTVEACCEAIMSGIPRAIYWWNTGAVLDAEATVWLNTEDNRKWIDRDPKKREIVGSSFIYQYDFIRQDEPRSFTEIVLPPKTVIEGGKPIPSKEWPYAYHPTLVMEGKFVRIAGYLDPSSRQVMSLFEKDEGGKEVVASHVPRDLNVPNPEYDSSLEKVTGICKAPVFHKKKSSICGFLYTGEFPEGVEKLPCPKCAERMGKVGKMISQIEPSIVRFNIKNSPLYRRKTRRWVSLWADFVAATEVYDVPHWGIKHHEDGSKEWAVLGYPFWRRICQVAAGPISRITKELFETPENELHGFSKKQDKKKSDFQMLTVISPDGTKSVKRVRVATLSSEPFDKDDVQPKTRTVKGLNRSYQKYLKGSGGRRERDPVSLMIEKEERQGAFGIIQGATETEAQQRDLRKWLNGAGPLTRNIRPILERMVQSNQIRMFKDEEMNNLKPEEQIDKIIAAVGENNRMIKNAAKIGFMLTDE